MKIIFVLVLLFLAIFGLSDLLHNAKLLLFKPHRNDAFVVCLLDENSSELNLKYIVENVSWKYTNYNKRIVAIDISNKELSVGCLKFANHHSIKVLKPSELEEFLNLWSS